ncbi:hypothetical protein, partial [Acinetobacter baumannii]|uniref:hypothetical protein n=1 Tax=Acinetobacter baumannii TaxID=470 RepID=UPI000A988530
VSMNERHNGNKRNAEQQAGRPYPCNKSGMLYRMMENAAPPGIQTEQKQWQDSRYEKGGIAYDRAHFRMEPV